jgi:hypothetical protein
LLVVSDLEDVFLPKPTDLLINLTEARAGIESLLGRLNEMFQEAHAVGSALGPALQAAYKLIVSRRLHQCGCKFNLKWGTEYDWRKDHGVDFYAPYVRRRCA